VTMWVIPDFRIWVIFLQGEKFWGERKFARLSASNFAVESVPSVITTSVMALFFRLTIKLVAVSGSSQVIRIIVRVAVEAFKPDVNVIKLITAVIYGFT
jgi:hypothetical protein